MQKNKTKKGQKPNLETFGNLLYNYVNAMQKSRMKKGWRVQCRM